MSVTDLATGRGKLDAMMRDSGSTMSVTERGCGRVWARALGLAAIWAGFAFASADAADPSEQKEPATVATPAKATIAPGENRVSPHVLAARKRAAGAAAAHPSISLQTQMQKRAARRQMAAGTRR
jgi:hypothetical protein